ncbi:MAG: urease accessory protein UreD [Pontibacterium sp.]
MVTTGKTPAGMEASRWHAYLNLGLVRSSRGTSLRTAEHKGPLYVQKAFYPEGKELAHVYLLHPPGGIVSGDELRIDVTSGENAHTLLTTPGAGRVYRARPDRTLQKQTINLVAKQGASLEWLPLETIVFPDAHTRLVTQIELAEGASFIGWEVCCLGLPASQETFDTGSVEQCFQVRKSGRIALRETMKIDDASRELFDCTAGFQQQPVNGVMVAGPYTDKEAAKAMLDELRAICERATKPALAGVSLVDEFIVVRYLGACSEEARKLFEQCWGVLRPALLSRPACPPRIWAT